MNRIEQIYSKNPQAETFAQEYLNYLGQVLTQLDVSTIVAFVQVLFQARERDARIFFIGNGGSAATASHFANDVTSASRDWTKPFRALSLADNLAIVTALANDHGYDKVFTRQLQVQMTTGDVVVAISASGNSPNIVQAVEYANANGATTVALTGFDGGKLKQIAHMSVHVPTNKGEYGPVEDAHMILDHLVGAFLMHTCRLENDLVEG